MSRHDYMASAQLEMRSYEIGCSFYGLLMAAMRRADTRNLEKLKSVFPTEWNELQARYHAPGGYLGLEGTAGTEEFTGQEGTDTPAADGREDEASSS